MDCPPRHTPYASQMLADGAAALHLLAFPRCGGFATWPCGDHFHVGHTSKDVGLSCKRNKMHLSMKRHLRSVYRPHEPQL